MFVSTKEYKELGPVAYHQWKDNGNCRLIHGYALSFYFEFESETLDSRNWVVDFGGLAPLKNKLEEWFDHKLLLAEDDPNFDTIMKLQDLKLAEITVVEATGCEAISDFLYKYINDGFLQELGFPMDVWCSKVLVRETGKNSAMRIGHRADGENLNLPLPRRK